MVSTGLDTEWSSTLSDASRDKKERNRANDVVITPILSTMTTNFRKESCINWMMCALCLGSLAVSGILTYREMRLESRIVNLEERCRIQELPDVLVQRLRRELREEFEQHRLAPASPVSAAALFRNKRDITECNCPPGAFNVTYFIVLTSNQITFNKYALMFNIFAGDINVVDSTWGPLLTKSLS
ncbi:hypothetical protein M0802_006479 [Mischocyttarus mexicanus]|nr:hypothetical protein M0802_006479 [Mischocyttarus mexicanus]